VVRKSGHEYNLLSVNWRLPQQPELVSSRADLMVEALPGMIEYLVARLKLFQ